MKEASETITAFQGLGAGIDGPDSICEGASALFKGTTQLAGQPQWQWIFHDGTLVNQQNPPAKFYDTAGSYEIKLIADNNGCKDTITKTLEVFAKPIVNLSARQAFLCEGSSLSVTASGGTTYAWRPPAGLNTTTNATVTVSPATNTTYTVEVTNDKGCTHSDSVRITVIHPFQMTLAPEVSLCSGSSVQLNASGAARYQWIGNTTGLSRPGIANPQANPPATTSYTVVGYDSKGCFTDTAAVKVIVHARPVVDAGPGAEIITGASYRLQASGSNDVVNWLWTPGKYLDCTTCQNPEAKPQEPMTYTITVTNVSGCTATDTVTVLLLCKASAVYIPNSFTPGHDGRNDVFRIRGYGIKVVKSLRIYNRWGELVFERSNFDINDQNAAWNGKYRGNIVPAGSYVYIAEMSCNENDFIQKGTVTVIY